jgi:hypothetical protein
MSLVPYEGRYGAALGKPEAIARQSSPVNSLRRN